MGKIEKASTDITKIERGSTDVNYVYRGTTLIWQKTPPVETQAINKFATTFQSEFKENEYETQMHPYYKNQF